MVVVKNLAAFEHQYGTGVNIAGQYTGSLENAGERIRLEDALGQTILDFEYRDGWREITDGNGFSLTIINPADPNINHWGQKDYWRASVYWGGSPGWDDSGILPNPGDVVINEVLAHSHAAAPDWIELYNTTDVAYHLSAAGISVIAVPTSRNIRLPQEHPYRRMAIRFSMRIQILMILTDPGCLVPICLKRKWRYGVSEFC